MRFPGSSELHAAAPRRPSITGLALATAVLLTLMVTPVQAEEAAVNVNDDLSITILSTMLADAAAGDSYSTIGEWGFAALVEVGGRKYLYDTGYHPDMVATNAAKLGIDLSVN